MRQAAMGAYFRASLRVFHNFRAGRFCRERRRILLRATVFCRRSWGPNKKPNKIHSKGLTCQFDRDKLVQQVPYLLPNCENLTC